MLPELAVSGCRTGTRLQVLLRQPLSRLAGRPFLHRRTRRDAHCCSHNAAVFESRRTQSNLRAPVNMYSPHYIPKGVMG
jgi:hypothetical protein